MDVIFCWAKESFHLFGKISKLNTLKGRSFLCVQIWSCKSGKQYYSEGAGTLLLIDFVAVGIENVILVQLEVNQKLNTGHDLLLVGWESSVDRRRC